jgi:hypothetical protein
MFESMIASALDPEMTKLLRAAKTALAGVAERLEAQKASGEPLRVLAAQAQLDAIAAWAPAVDEMLKAIEAKPAVHPAVPHR